MSQFGSKRGRGGDKIKTEKGGALLLLGGRQHPKWKRDKQPESTK
jgi:hypothetical protein